MRVPDYVLTIKEVIGHESVRVTEEYLRELKKGPGDAMRSIKL